MNSEGFKVLGYPAVNGTVNESGELTPLVVQKGGALPPEVTTTMGVTANLDSQAADGTEFKAGVQIFDSLGASQLVTVTFAKTGSGAWTWTATLPATATGGAETDPPVQVGTGALTFDSNGVLTSPATNPTISIAGLADGASNMDVTLELVDSAGQPRLTNYAATSERLFDQPEWGGRKRSEGHQYRHERTDTGYLRQWHGACFGAACACDLPE